MKRRNFLFTAASGLIGAGIGYGAAKVSLRKSEMSAPAVASGKRELTMVMTWPSKFPGLGTGAERLADSITAATDGRLTVKLYGAGELVPAFESFDTVSQGTADMMHAASYYWVGKSQGFAFFTAVPFGFTAAELNAWVYWGGGQELWDKLGADFNIKSFLGGNTGVQMGGWFRKEMNSLEDFKGMKMRIPGLAGSVLDKVGGSAVTLPGGEIFQALQSGTIDATEWVGPWNDQAMGFYKVAKFYYYPGFHEPGAGLECAFNLDTWNSFSASDQSLLQGLCTAENANMYAEYTANNSAALASLINDEGVQLKRFSSEIFAGLKKAWDSVLDENILSGNDAKAKEIAESYLTFRKEVIGWTGLSEQAYTYERAKLSG